MNRIAVFDLDHTLACKNVSYAFGTFLYKEHVLSGVVNLSLIIVYFLHKWRFLSLRFLHQFCIRVLFSKLPVHTLQALVEKFLDKYIESLLRPTVHAYLQQEQNMADVLLLSSSPDFLVQPLAKRLKITHVAGTKYEVSNGCYASCNLVLDGVSKVEFVKTYIHNTQKKPARLVVYSDSIVDLPLLEYAEIPVVVAPDKVLRKIAVARSWKIIEG